MIIVAVVVLSDLDTIFAPSIVRLERVKAPLPLISPTTSNFSVGADVPIPTLFAASFGSPKITTLSILAVDLYPKHVIFDPDASASEPTTVLEEPFTLLFKDI